MKFDVGEIIFFSCLVGKILLMKSKIQKFKNKR